MENAREDILELVESARRRVAEINKGDTMFGEYAHLGESTERLEVAIGRVERWEKRGGTE